MTTLKILCLTASFSVASIFSIAEIIFSPPSYGFETYPLVSSQSIDELICYMQITDGRILDLSDLCSKPQVEIGEVFRSNGYISGNIINKTDKTVHDIRVTYEVLNAGGTVIERDSTSTNPQALAPGESAMFKVITVNSGTVRIASVIWNV
ncbi:hypothetical protein H6F90_02700 [Trichocoleus sp. FACHB-591]|uniref:FxLYD domain-containing protein n=1 Tax=Trichocoleus sp. FACHB-591 TaxID=2692872 RepID=UPI0016895102|nr:FxLYD domain-containing protein [Trichocoleus sp. FACHB-591]MBD2094063.1 hypothetical protein [Trichocoleus sp. FACHB-591]